MNSPAHSRHQDDAPGERGVGDTLRARRTQLRWPLQKLADLLGCAKGYLSEVETGKRRPPADEVLAKAESLLMLAPGSLVSAARWERSLHAGGQTIGRAIDQMRHQNRAARQLADLLRSRGRNKSIDSLYRSGDLKKLIDEIAPEEAPHAQVGAANERSRDIARVDRLLPVEIPLINKVAAGYPREFTDLAYPARIADEYVRCPNVSDPDAFAARVVGDSMMPDYREGDVIVFSPTRDVKSGNDCFVRLERDAETTFKRVYFEIGPAGEELIRLQPINNAYPPRVLPREDVAGCYAAVKAIREIG